MGLRTATKVLLLSDFNLGSLAGYLENAHEGPAIATTIAPFAELGTVLHNPDHEVWSKTHDALLIWTTPSSAIASFQAALDFRPWDREQLLGEVDAYADLLISTSAKVPVIFVATWVLPSWRRGLGLGEFGPSGAAALLAEMNLRLMQRLQRADGIYILNTSSWIETAGPAAWSSKLWYMSKQPFSQPVFKAAASEVISSLRALTGGARKLIVLDLDDTLWGGIVGDVGWENLRLGGHDPIGEAYLDFQRQLKALKNRGILLAIVSKNQEAIALQAIRMHPHMLLKCEDFVGWRINWDDKAANIASLLNELNLGAQAAVFIDDNPAERGRVRESLPEVMVPPWPDDKMLFAQKLQTLPCFDAPGISREDRERTELYDTERHREQAKARVASIEEWLNSLQLVVTAEELHRGNLKRIAQLLNKTNQMNLATRRLTEAELWQWASAPGRKVMGLTVRDRFGDSGLTGIVSIERQGTIAHIRDFVLSCRVFGRQIEKVMLHLAGALASDSGATTLAAAYQETEKNKPCLEFFSSCGLARATEEAVFSWDLSESYPVPPFITLISQNDEADRRAHRA